MDAIDKKIISLLSENARLSSTTIAKAVHRSRVAVAKRIEILIEKGEITGFKTCFKRKPCPVLFEVIFNTGGSCDFLIPKVRDKFQIINAWSVAGTTDLFIWSEMENAQEVHVMRIFLAAQPEVFKIITHAISRTFE